ncbi:MAG TPA: ABC transporter ATP-binding protein [Anaerolineaceae bacterium]|nr:ABC transporter ATP-binding protein [Anaerolineaceae bacterium]
METEILIAHDLHKSFSSQPAVRGISFSIAQGEIFGLLGPNGAGKSTTISMLAGLIPPTSGSIEIDGLDLRSHPNEVKARLGLVPQDLALYPTLSAWDNLAFFAQIYGLRGRVLKQRVTMALEMVQLLDRAKEPVRNYSGGMKRRVNLAAGLLHQPKILFLDEPTVGVDPQSRNAIFESIEALNRQGLTVIYTTHYMEEAERLCQRVAIIDHGQIIAQDTPANLIRSLGAGVIRMGILDGQIQEVQRQSAQLASISSIVQRDHLLDIQSQDTQMALIQVLDITNRLNAKVTSLEILDASLETVFLNLTGKSIRD